MRWIVLALGLVLMPAMARAEQLTVFAAASLTNALKDIGVQWQKAGHGPVRFSFASSSTLARQIAEGAPANLFASADVKWMDFLDQKHLLAAGTRQNLLTNRLALIVPFKGPDHVAIGPNFDLAAVLGPGGRLAVGNPKDVPAGIYAEQALKKLGVWNYAEKHLAPAEDVRGALLYVERGEAPAGIVYSTDAAVSKEVKIAGVFPADTHEAIVYPFAVVKAGDTKEARDFLGYLAGPAAQGVFERFGFGVRER